ncbi:MAG TPA: PD-(D/E)XK nuclease superfamily protein [Vicinamibacterales bacterium]|nr:PD-(D/E)XK nuclease superfamily protein [Vicinamibacterales bacterium]
MSPGSTRTGGVLERMILPALDEGGYTYETQVLLGRRLGLGRHVVDAVAHKAGRNVLISLKWQQVSGTAEQKVPFEVICLLEALQTGEHDKAYLVLGGEGWTLRNFYTAGGLKPFLVDSEKVDVVTLEGFVGRANQGKL